MGQALFFTVLRCLLPVKKQPALFHGGLFSPNRFISKDYNCA